MSALLPKLTKEVFLKKIQNCRQSQGESVLSFDFMKKRCRILTKHEEVKDDSNGILYWMSRDCRVQDNWALLFAQRLAMKQNLPLYVCFFSKDSHELYPTRRQFKFLIEGLKFVEEECRQLNIGFYLIDSSPLEIIDVVKNNNIGCVVCEFSPLKLCRKWKNELVEKLGDVPLAEVDAHNIVPCWITSDKKETAARTIRPKIFRHLKYYLTEFPPVVSHPYSGSLKISHVKDFDQLINNYKPDHIREVEWAKPGPEEGIERLRILLTERLKVYAGQRNDPSKDVLSNLSPWLHFGQVSAQRCAWEVQNFRLFKAESEDFMEELIVRRELTDNYCYYNSNYDNINGAEAWALKTLNDHRKDKRKYIYSRQEFEEAKTHDNIWNAAQLELLQRGKIHGYMRMYWCKKILEWTESPEKAIEIALYLNDTFSLDGSDPNGFVGVMWSICGVHDQGFKEREIFGKIRYMVDYSLRRKCDIDSYCAKFGLLSVKEVENIEITDDEGSMDGVNRGIKRKAHSE